VTGSTYVDPDVAGKLFAYIAEQTLEAELTEYLGL
jgi:hypothetical protein